MRIQDMPRTLSGEIDISFLKKLPFWNQQFGTGEDSLQVEFHTNLNSLVNSFETQVNGYVIRITMYVMDSQSVIMFMIM